MYKCKKYHESEYTKAGFVKGEQDTNVKIVVASLCLQGIRVEVK